MRKHFLIFCLLFFVFLFAFQSFAVEDFNRSCENIFEDLTNNQIAGNKASARFLGNKVWINKRPESQSAGSLRNKAWINKRLAGQSSSLRNKISEDLLAPSASNKKISQPKLQSLVSFIPYTITSPSNQKARLSQDWKKQVLENLSYFEASQVLVLFNRLAQLAHALDLEFEKSFFKVLKPVSVKYVAGFNKEQLVDIVWIFIQLGVEPGEDFIRLWSEAAVKKRREFQSIDRYVLHDWFQQLKALNSKAQL